jgi:transposase
MADSVEERARRSSEMEERRRYAASQRKTAVQMSTSGASLDSVAQRLGVSPGQVRKMFSRELKALGGDSSERELRVVHVEALMELWRVLYPAAAAGDLAAVDRFVRVEERLARLLGLDLADQAQRPEHADGAGSEVDDDGARSRRFVRSE